MTDPTERPARTSTPDAPTPDAVIFDLGGVLIDWNPRYLYRSLLPDEAAVEAFLEEVGFAEWNGALDAGGDWDEAVEDLASRHPERRALIEAFRDRWEETLGQPIEPIVAVLRELVDAGIRTFALSNWSARTFAVARRRFDFLDCLEGIVVSGEVGMTKPDAGIYRALLERYGLDAARTVFVDDRRDNVEAAERLGIRGILLPDADAASLRRALRHLGLRVASSGRAERSTPNG